MNGLDPSVLAATDDSAAPLLDANLVKSITQDDRDPAWSTVEFADGRVENRPTADAVAMPKVPPPAPMGPPPAPVGAGNPPPVDGGFSLTPEQQAATSATPENTLAFGGAGGDPAVPQGPGFGQMQPTTGGAPGQLPAPEGAPPGTTDPGATIVGEGGGSTPYSTTETGSRTEEEFAVDPTQLAQDQAQGMEDISTGLEQRERYNASVRGESIEEGQRRADEQLRKAAIFTEESKHALQVVEDTPIEEDFYKGSPGRQVAAWVALALSGFLQGATKGANPALNQMMQSLTRAQENFVANQRADKNSKLAQRQRALGSAEAAEASIRMQLPSLVEKYAQQHAAKVGQQEIPPGLSTAVAAQRVKAMEHQQRFAQHPIARTEQRLAEERRAAPTGPVFQADRELQALGIDRKAHADAMDPKGLNLGGVVGGAQDMAAIASALKKLQGPDGNLASQGTFSWTQLGLAPFAARMGIKNAEEQVTTRQLIEQAKLAFKQTINIKSVDSENEGKNFNAIMDSGDGSTTVAAIEQKARESNRNAIGIASGVSRNPQGYLEFIDRTLSSNRGVSQRGAGAPPAIRERVVRPAPESTGEAPAPGPLGQSPREGKAPEASPATGSRRGTYRRLRESKPDEPR